MGSDFERLENAEAELKGRIKEKELQCKSLKEICEKLEEEIDQTFTYVRKRLSEDLEEIYKFRPHPKGNHLSSRY